MKNLPYYRQADLLLRLLPYIDQEKDFALHGGTALNFFVRDFPRLSVDIDLTYLPIEPREETLLNISKKLKGLAKKFRKVFPRALVTEKTSDEGHVEKLGINHENAIVKIEPNLVIRGSVFGVEERWLVNRAQEEFEKSVQMRTLPVHALYGSKICAALDRQHPRDLFDVKLLFENEGFNESVRKAFLVYLMSSKRPMNELLNSSFREARSVFENQFSGMSLIPCKYEDLEKTHEQLMRAIREGLSAEERKFLLSFKEGIPDWSLLGVAGVEALPAVQWKLSNIARMDGAKKVASIEAIRRILDGDLNG
jgi:predicted nucleotidyltransferase component of viral defense system